MMQADEMAAEAMAELTEAVAGKAGALERFAPEILRTFLEGASWAEAMEEFFVTNCPQFDEFEAGGEYGLHQWELHQQFVATAEALLDRQLDQMHLSADRFLELTLADLHADPGSPATVAAQAVMDRLEECRDFERFGVMMRKRHDFLYDVSSTGFDNGDQHDDGSRYQHDGAAGVGEAEEGEEEEEGEGEDEEGMIDHAAQMAKIREDSLRRRQQREEAMRCAALELLGEDPGGDGIIAGQ